MNLLIGSVLRHLERLLKKMKTGAVLFNYSIPSTIEYILAKLAYYGNKLLELIVYFAKRVSRLANLLQISMIDSMIVASLWYGFLVLALMLIVLYLYIVAGD